MYGLENVKIYYVKDKSYKYMAFMAIGKSIIQGKKSFINETPVQYGEGCCCIYLYSPWWVSHQGHNNPGKRREEAALTAGGSFH